LSDFRYKWFVGRHQITPLEETENHFKFRINKHLIKHEPIGADKSWVVTRVAKNVFILHPKFENEIPDFVIRNIQKEH